MGQRGRCPASQIRCQCHRSPARLQAVHEDAKMTHLPPHCPGNHQPAWLGPQSSAYPAGGWARIPKRQLPPECYLRRTHSGVARCAGLSGGHSRSQESVMDCVGQTSTQAPQSPQVSGSTWAFSFSILIASNGQAWTYSPQPLHVSWLTTAGMVPLLFQAKMFRCDHPKAGGMGQASTPIYFVRPERQKSSSMGRRKTLV